MPAGLALRIACADSVRGLIAGAVRPGCSLPPHVQRAPQWLCALAVTTCGGRVRLHAHVPPEQQAMWLAHEATAGDPANAAAIAAAATAIRRDFANRWYTLVK